MIKFNEIEEKIMVALWELGKAFPKEIIHLAALYETPYNTVLSTIRKLENEGRVGYKVIGKSHRYFPILKRKDYTGSLFSKLFKGMFDNSPEKLLSHFVETEDVTPEELKKILNSLNDK